jgi:hypothetical protein
VACRGRLDLVPQELPPQSAPPQSALPRRILRSSSLGAGEGGSAQAAGLCRPARAHPVAPQAVQHRGRHNHEVGMIGVMPTSALRRLCRPPRYADLGGRFVVGWVEGREVVGIIRGRRDRTVDGWKRVPRDSWSADARPRRDTAFCFLLNRAGAAGPSRRIMPTLIARIPLRRRRSSRRSA